MSFTNVATYYVPPHTNSLNSHILYMCYITTLGLLWCVFSIYTTQFLTVFSFKGPLKQYYYSVYMCVCLSVRVKQLKIVGSKIGRPRQALFCMLSQAVRHQK